jgi:hypothetical protein
MTKEGRSFGRLRIGIIEAVSGSRIESGMTMEGRFFDSVPLRSRSLKRARPRRDDIRGSG